MKYRQMKYWLTRRMHLYRLNATGMDYSLCGLAIKCGCYPHKAKIDWKTEDEEHPYDNLNYCQSCRRKAMKIHEEKYVPLTGMYPDPRPKDIEERITALKKKEKK